MNRVLTACSLIGVLIGAGACGNSTPSPVHKNTHDVSGGVVTSMASTQSMDDSRSCERTPAQAECATVWTIAYRDKSGKTHLAKVTEAVFNDCLHRFPGGRYPDCAHGGHR